MSKSFWRCWIRLAVLHGAAVAVAQQPALPSATPPQIWTWNQVKDQFELNNTTLMAGKLNIDELKAQEITAHLRPNPDFTLSADGTQIAPSKGVWQPFAGTFVSPGISYLFERRNKRGLRFEAQRRHRRSASRSIRTRNAICSSICAVLSSVSSRPRRCCAWRRTISTTTTRS